MWSCSRLFEYLENKIDDVINMDKLYTSGFVAALLMISCPFLVFPSHSYGSFIRIHAANVVLLLCIQPFRDSLWGHLDAPSLLGSLGTVICNKLCQAGDN